MKYLYFPGCSQKATSRSYEESFLAVCKTLGIEIEELEDWNCCGTTAVVSVNKVLALSLAARNLALAKPSGSTLITPCPSCRLSMDKANRTLSEKSDLSEKVTAALSAGGYEYDGSVEVRHIMDVLANDYGADKIAERVKVSLSGIKVAPYYGCQIVRPYSSGDDPDNPVNMERLIEAVGGEPISFPLRTRCCGGALMAAQKDTAVELSSTIIQSMFDNGADVVATPCSLCQVNLELAQSEVRTPTGERIDLPILTITQLIGTALGIDFSTLGINRSLCGGGKLRSLLAEKTPV